MKEKPFPFEAAVAAVVEKEGSFLKMNRPRQALPEDKQKDSTKGEIRSSFSPFPTAEWAGRVRKRQVAHSFSLAATLPVLFLLALSELERDQSIGLKGAPSAAG